MKAPKAAGTPIDMRRIRDWLTDFTGYRHTITEDRIGRWLDQFDLPDIDLAARLLDCVDFISGEKIGNSFRTSLNSLPGWHRDPAKRVGKWRFAAFSTSSGESGDAMLAKFRHANNLATRNFNSLFVHRSELLTADLGPDDTLVFIDDFSGSGKQVTDAWPLFMELLPGGPTVHLVLIAATTTALERINRETDLAVCADVVLHDSDAIFLDACTRFTSAEKATLKTYCDRAVASSARQFSEAGYVIVFSHTCPNNTISVLNASTSQEFEGLFRRYD